MTVESIVNKKTYTGDGSQPSFPYTFRIFDETDLTVYVAGELQQVNVHYNVTNVGNPDGGNVEFITSPNPDYDYTPAMNASVVILRKMPMEQLVDLVQYGRYDAETIEQSLDKIIMLIQQLSEIQDRSLSLPEQLSAQGLYLPTPEAGKAMVWNITGDALLNSEYVLDDAVNISKTARDEAVAAAIAAGASEVDAEDAATQAGASEVAADSSATAAAASEVAAAASELASANSETAAASSATTAAASETAAAGSATAAASSETAAASSQTAAASSAAAASASEINAASSKTAAATSEQNASASETAAAGSATSAATSAAEALASKTAAATSETNAAASETAAAGSKTAAANSATAAASSETAAAASETSAASSATAAAASETSAAASAADAATSLASLGDAETNAAASALAAQQAAASAAASYDAFDDRYLGSKTVEPTADNDGAPLEKGMLYFHSGSGMKVYDGAGWVSASASGVASLVIHEFTAAAGQTLFSGMDANGVPLSYISDSLIVLLNGTVLRAEDYTANDGTSVTLILAANAGEELTVLSFKSFVVADHYTKAQADALLAGKSDSHAHPYASDAHNHDGVYAPVHTHPYASNIHNHDGVYLKPDGDGSQLTGIQTSPYDQAASSTGFFALPKGSTAQRPSSPQNGYMRFNTTDERVEWYHAPSEAWWPFHEQASVATEVEYMIVAGGGSGGYRGSRWGGSGGAGGYRSSVIGEMSGGGQTAEDLLYANKGDVYTVTVGAGAPPPAYEAGPIKGSDSKLGTIVSVGGGGGGSFSGGSGGSGGGGSNGAGGGSGTAGQGFAAGPSGDNDAGGGGGGAGEMGQKGGGGNGVIGSINGTAKRRASGGNSGYWTNDGGGNNSSPNGAANTGHGGAGRYSSTGGSGGSGIVILRYPGSVAVATGGSISYVNGYVVHTFTSSGTFAMNP